MSCLELHYSIVKDLFALLQASKKTPKIQHSTYQPRLRTVLSAQLRAALNQPIRQVRISCPTDRPGCITPRDFSLTESQESLVEARGFEPLTSGLQSPRSAKLSYAPKA